MRTRVLFLCVAILAAPASGVLIAAPPLDQIMADPAWIGPPVEGAYWSVDGTSVYYQLKRADSTIRDLHAFSLRNGTDRVLGAADQSAADGPAAVFDRARKRAVFIRHGDVFLRDRTTGRLAQLTRTVAEELTPRFSADEKAVHFRADKDWFIHDLTAGVTVPAAVIKLENDPDKKKLDEFEKTQLRLSGTLRREKTDREAVRKNREELNRGDSTRAPSPFYLGDKVTVADASLSPDGAWLLVVTEPKSFEKGRAGKMPKYVTESGYEEIEDVRQRVGRNGFVPQRLRLLDSRSGEAHEISLAGLPGIEDDPLAAIRAENAKAKAESEAKEAAKAKAAGKAEEKPKEAKQSKDHEEAKEDEESKESKDKKGKDKKRVVRIEAIQFARDGSQAAVRIRAADNKDRWIATVDRAARTVVSQHRLTDTAWVNWDDNDFGWLDDNKTLYYLSEESGFSHLYVKPLGDASRALTSGGFEVSDPVLSPDGRWFYARANVEAPYIYDVYRVAVGGGTLERVSSLKGTESFVVSPDGGSVLVSHSSSYVPRQISIVGADGTGTPSTPTDTRTAEYKAIRWQEPEIVGVPSSHTKAPIWSKFYKPSAASSTKRPIVLFVHGAGYTQNTHLRFPYYFREQMFHNLLTERGYLVLDMDYRASEGYGRDWRTAIYRQMGHPELEDLLDGIDWLVKNHNGDPQRVGVYGGSYGGFMALMALFRAPESFAVGAALRPVTDWSQYDHEYTSAILNTPKDDEIAYRRSSPIEFADRLKAPLLIAHGMIDDNVFIQDSVRLFQRLIELKKENVELRPYPLERHSFVHPEAWRDEYAAILKLFETMLSPR